MIQDISQQNQLASKSLGLHIKNPLLIAITNKTHPKLVETNFLNRDISRAFPKLHKDFNKAITIDGLICKDPSHKTIDKTNKSVCNIRRTNNQTSLFTWREYQAATKGLLNICHIRRYTKIIDKPPNIKKGKRRANEQVPEE